MWCLWKHRRRSREPIAAATQLRQSEWVGATGQTFSSLMQVALEEKFVSRQHRIRKNSMFSQRWDVLPWSSIFLEFFCSPPASRMSSSLVLELSRWRFSSLTWWTGWKLGFRSGPPASHVVTRRWRRQARRSMILRQGMRRTNQSLSQPLRIGTRWTGGQGSLPSTGREDGYDTHRRETDFYSSVSRRRAFTGNIFATAFAQQPDARQSSRTFGWGWRFHHWFEVAGLMESLSIDGFALAELQWRASRQRPLPQRLWNCCCEDSLCWHGTSTLHPQIITGHTHPQLSSVR